MKANKVPKKVKRRVFLLASVFCVIVVALVASVFRDWQQIMQNRKETKTLSIQYNHLLSEEESLESEITKLKDTDYMARYAREKFWYSLPNEVIIKVPNEDTNEDK